MLGRTSCFPITESHFSRSLADDAMNRNARSRDIRVNEFSLPVICSAPLIHWHSFKWTHSVGVVSPWDLKLQRNSGVRTTQRFRHRIRCFDCFTRAPSIMISPWSITGRSDIFRPKRQRCYHSKLRKHKLEPKFRPFTVGISFPLHQIYP